MKHIQVVIVLVCIFVNLTLPAFGREVTLYWEPSPSPEVFGYKVYYQQGSPQLPLSGTEADQGTSPIDVENYLMASVSGLEEKVAYYFSVTAYDSNNNESTFSNIVSTAWMPSLLSPQKESIVVPWGVTFQWEAGPAEHDLNYTYTLYYGTDKNMVLNAGVAPPGIGKSPTTSWPISTNNLLAFIVLLLVLTLFSTTAKKGRQAVCLPRAAVAGIFILALVACGGGGGSGSSVDGTDQSSASLMIVDTYDIPSYQTDLPPGETIYYKVDAHSTTEPGTVFHSETYRFTTQFTEGL